MSTFIYASQDTEVQSALKQFAAKHAKGAQVVVEASNMMEDWSNRSLGEVLNSAKAGDTVVVFDAVNTARSHTQVLGFLEACLEKGVNVNFARYGMVFQAEATSNFMTLLNLSRKIEADFVSRRNQEAIAKRQEFGIVLGRPKGRKNKALKLDKYKKDIMRYLELSISKASIAKLVDCHPQTLYDWIERNEMGDAKPSRRSKEDELV